ncbi:hypothetical protein FOZ61_010015 [Perkinsus olseni]|uniref:Uncharacterized protein n=1 Tax=Perkinsus olseni TaxID=32597 RepID=A0A7J6KZK5_PEROL|nr:hypothetical protein FOZ61_010015 [Perkinsus olseni]
MRLSLFAVTLSALNAVFQPSDTLVRALPGADDAAQKFLSVARDNEARVLKNERYTVESAAEAVEDIWGDVRLLASDDSQGTFGKWSNPVIIISSVVVAVVLFFLVCCCGCGTSCSLGPFKSRLISVVDELHQRHRRLGHLAGPRWLDTVH